MLGVYTILAGQRAGLGLARRRSASAPSRSPWWPAFVVRQARIANPLMPLRLFHSRNVAGANVVRRCSSPACSAMFFLGALYLQRVLGYDPLEVGLAFLPTTLVMGTLSLGFSEKLIMRFGPRTTLIPGVALDRRRPAALRPHAGRRQLPRPTSCRRCC